MQVSIEPLEFKLVLNDENDIIRSKQCIVGVSMHQFYKLFSSRSEGIGKSLDIHDIKEFPGT